MLSWNTRTAVSLLAVSLLVPATPTWANVPGVTEGMAAATQGIVSSSHPLASEAGRRILAAGGNAVDAAAAMQMALNVVEPMMSGMGGGGFMLIYLKDQNKVTVIDSRESAPAKADKNLFLDKDGKPIEFGARHTSGNAVGVPGTLLGVETALAKYGTMNWSQVLEPAIRYAQDGVPVNWATEMYVGQNVQKLQKYGTAGNVFAPNGQGVKQGDILKQPDLAKTLKLVAEKGSDVLYKGEVGEALVAEVQKRGGVMTTEDLRNYKVYEREPVRGDYRGYEVVSMSPPSSGGLTVLSILNLLEGYDLKKMGANSTDYLHRFIEASHLAYADRAKYMADEDFHAVPKQGLLADAYIAERRQQINPGRASTNVKAGDPWKHEPNKAVVMEGAKEDKPIGQTTHFAAIDKWGNMVSYTTTIEQVFGSGIMVPGYGFMLNNELTDFDAVPGGVNEVAPGKRPLSSMSPTLVLKDGKPFMALGAPGGPTIISSVAQTIINVIDFGMGIQDAIYAPIVYSSSYPTVRYEPGFHQDVLLGLTAKGHALEPAPVYISNLQAVLIDAASGKMYGGADNTRQGTVLGVDNVSYTAPQAPPVPKAQRPFHVMVNKGSVPFTGDQLLLQDGRTYVRAEGLLKTLGFDQLGSFKSVLLTKDGQAYLPLRHVAETLGYAVAWDGAKSTVQLTKDMPASSGSDYYSEDKFKITN